MKKLVLYSDQIPSVSEKIDEELVAILGKSKPIIGYIPSSADPQRRHYRERQTYYSRLGMDLKVYFELAEDYHPDLLESLLSCDAIHLSGGNTYYFLQWLRKRGMFLPLRQYVERGGVLIGVSAGSILMTPDIAVTAIWREIGEVKDDLSALCFVDFAFVPHFGGRSPVSLAALQEYSRKHRIVVYACEDSGGLAVIDEEVKCVGNVVRIHEN